MPCKNQADRYNSIEKRQLRNQRNYKYLQTTKGKLAKAEQQKRYRARKKEALASAIC